MQADLRGWGIGVSKGRGRIDLAKLPRPETQYADKVDDHIWLMEIQVGHPADKEKTGHSSPKHRGGKADSKLLVPFPSGIQEKARQSDQQEKAG